MAAHRLAQPWGGQRDRGSGADDCVAAQRRADFFETKGADYLGPGQIVSAAFAAFDKAAALMEIEVRRTPEGDVLWQIHDHGEGMSVHGLRALGQPTSGLGVMFAWAVVEHHGGLLHFESAPGGGTTATIWLPG